MATDYDAIVIGGGITGAGLLRDLALRGVKALLLEKGKPGHRTTASSTHLIHGGLRYLLYDRLTTHVTCWDSGNIVRVARPLLTRLPIVWPVYNGHTHGLETVETLLESYDRFSAMKYGLLHLRLSAEQTLKLLPQLSPDGLLGSLSFDEWWVDPVELVEANLHSARANGAETLTETAAERLLRDGGAVSGVVARCRDGQTREIRSRLVINAAGPWVDQVAGLAGARIALRLQKGTHLVYDSWRLGASPIGLLLEAQDKDRYVFVVSPGSGKETLVGPTDLAGGTDPDRTATTPEEIEYLLKSARRYLPALPERYDRTIVGARPILGQATQEKLLSREFEVFDHEAREGVKGFITVAGGKMSDFRLMAQEGGDLAAKKLGAASKCKTQLLTLDGKPVENPGRDRLPGPALRRFLRRHPVIREGYSMGFLAERFVRHVTARAVGRAKADATAEQARAYYAADAANRS